MRSGHASRRALCRALLTLASIVPLALCPAAGATAAGGFGVRPAHVDPSDSSTRAYFKRSVEPGGSFADQVIVTNEGDVPLGLLVSAVDALTGATTGTVYANRQDPQRAAGAWLRGVQGSLTLPARTERAVAFTVKVPADATPGDHVAGIAFEETLPGATGSGFSITQVIREVVGVLVNVPGPARAFTLNIGPPAVRVSGSGSMAIAVDLGNDGQVLGKPYLWAVLDGPRGYHRDLRLQLDTILPGDRVAYLLAWPGVAPEGRVHVCVAGGLATDEQARSCAWVDVATRPATIPSSLRPLAAGGQPWWILLPGFLAGLLVGLLVARRRIRRPGRR